MTAMNWTSMLTADSHFWIHAVNVKKATEGPHPLSQEDVAPSGSCLQELWTDHSDLSDSLLSSLG